MDYVLYQIIMFFMSLYHMCVLYDIWCYYWVHLKYWFENSPSLALPEQLELTGGIDKFHVHGHKRDCYPRHSPNFIPGVGVQVGDVIETLWVNTNQIANSTRGMSSAHRQETIDDIMNNSNWTKLTRISKQRLLRTIVSL